MVDRRKTPSVLDNLLGSIAMPEPEIQNPVKPVRHRTTKPASPHSVATDIQADTNPASQKSSGLNMTLTLTSMMLNRVDNVCLLFRKATGKQGISRGDILEAALQLALDDFDLQGADSGLVRVLVDKLVAK
jgi:hypothetical protein